jgi:hypothetical protein
LHELDVTDPVRLHTCAQTLFSAPPCGRSESRWTHTFALLANVLTEGGSHGLGKEGEWPNIELKRNTLGRAKMLWNYLRSALPERMFSPHILRAKTLNDLLVAIHRTAGSAGDDGMLLLHRPEIDWLYAGGRDPSDKTSDSTESPSADITQESCGV